MPPDDRPVPSWIPITCVLSVACLSALTVVGDPSALLPLDIACGALGSAAAALLARPRPGGPVAVALAVLAAVSPAATPASTAAALRIAMTRPIPVAVGVAGAGIGCHLLRYAWRPEEGLPFWWWAVLVLVAHAALLGWGAFARSRRALIESLRERAHRAEAEQERRLAEARRLERTRIAREMHDVLAHRLSLVAAYAGALEFRPDSAPEQLARAAAVVRAGAHQALDELREVIGVLRSEPGADPELDPDAGPAVRPQPTAADVARLVEEVRAAGVDVVFDDRTGADLPDGTGRTVYRVVQEGLTNARKHAVGQRVAVEIGGEHDIVVEVRNTLGAAAGPGGAPPGSGTGLVGLAERVQLAGGRLEHGIVDGEFRLRAALPRQGRS